MEILFADKVHYKEKNFRSLYLWMKQYNLKPRYLGEYDGLKSLFGDYQSKEEFLSGYTISTL